MSRLIPYDYQLDVGERLLRGENVVLQAPTGAGKTMAALLPFLNAWQSDGTVDFPKKCVYVVPMRVLAHQFVEAYREIAASISRLYRRELKVSIQTGDQSEDPRFEADLIFCTIDQFLSSYLTMPYSLPRRLANVNAGAMIGTYLVFDEFHLLDPESSLPSTLYAIKELAQYAPVLLMTATFSSTMLQSLASTFGATSVLVSQDEARRIATRNGEEPGRRRIWSVDENLLSPHAVLARHQTRTLALCNTVERAQKLYRALRAELYSAGSPIELRLLHSRFLSRDRRTVEDYLRLHFGKDNDGSGSIIAIATQTIEVGVDISCQTLHTELAPASSLIQRAGRCARYPGQEGQVIVYPVESFAPYDRAHVKGQTGESPWVMEMRAALDYLRANSDQDFDFGKEQELVDVVATQRDRQVILALNAGAPSHRAAIHRVLDGEIGGQDRRLLVRDTDSLTVLIHPEPEQLLETPYAATGFSIARQTLHSMIRRWLACEEDCEWRVKALLEDSDDMGQRNPEKYAEDNLSRYGWVSVNHPAAIQASRVVVVNPQLAGYLSDEGFVADVGNTPFVSMVAEDAGKRIWEGSHYRLEDYVTHIGWVMDCFEDLARPELAAVAPAVERVAGWQPGSLMQAAYLVCLLHDVGKLSRGWQGWARRYQQAIGRPMAATYVAAHTDREWRNPLHEEGEKTATRGGARPNHAGESALAVSGVLMRALNNERLCRAALTAITRHHTPYARTCETYTLVEQAVPQIGATLALVDAALQAQVDLTHLRTTCTTPPLSFAGILATPNDLQSWTAYLLLVRALRRADQEGTRRGMQSTH